MTTAWQPDDVPAIGRVCRYLRDLAELPPSCSCSRGVLITAVEILEQNVIPLLAAGDQPDAGRGGA